MEYRSNTNSAFNKTLYINDGVESKENHIQMDASINRLGIKCHSEERNHPIIPELVALPDDQKIKIIENHFSEILKTLGLDLNNDSMTKTPFRFAKMVVQELFTGLREENFPSITTQENSFGYDEMLLESHIGIKSICEHHFMPILGYCHIAYVPQKRVIGLSKLSRVAKYYAARPQVQERMTMQIKNKLIEILDTEDVAVVIDAQHLCVGMRGIEDADSKTRTCGFSGCFKEVGFRKLFLDSIVQMNNVKM